MVVESTPLDTTGGHTWKAAYRLADFLEASAQQLGLDKEGLKVLELGSGTGWLGVTLARNLPAAALVCLTEQEAGLAWLQHNVQLNQARGLWLAHVRVRPCDWLHYAAATAAAPATAAFEQPGSPSGKGQSSSLGLGPQGCSNSRGSTGKDNASSEGSIQAGLQPACCQDGGCGAGAAGPSAAAAAARVAAARAAHGAAALLNTGAGEVGRPMENVLENQWDFIVGSDLIYNQVATYFRCCAACRNFIC